MSGNADLEFFALCPAGFEAPLADELRELGCLRVRPLKGNVAFFGDVRSAYRACLWARLASRVVMVVARIGCTSVDELYQGCAFIPWEKHIGPQATIAVDARGGSSSVHDMRFASLRVKDAVCDRLRAQRGERPFVDADSPDVRITCTVREKRATIGIDLSGASLIDHGYRIAARPRKRDGATAFVREDLAAYMLRFAGWGEQCAQRDCALMVDALGSSTTLALEAACIAADRAPGLTRRRWGFAGWAGHDSQAWEEELAAAQRRFDAGRACGRRVVVASTDAGVRDEIAAMARKAGVEGVVEVLAGGPTALEGNALGASPTLLACAVPDAGRDGAAADLPARLAAFAALARREPFASAPTVALFATELFEGTLGIEPSARRHVINGSTESDVALYPPFADAAPAHLPPARTEGEGARREGVPKAGREGGGAVAASCEIELPGGKKVSVLVPASDQFAARLAKVARQRAKWARRTGVSCYRVYDADLPDYAVSVDLYEGCAASPGRWVVVNEYAAPREIDPATAARRLSDALAIVPPVMEVDPEDVFLKVRRRSKGGAQYTGYARHGRTALVEEGGLVFEVNFTDHLDTGIFLDHRDVRSMLREMAPRTRFLNLFAYTGTASCYAADGDAYTTTTVDISANYLNWARRNMEQNGFAGRAHEYVQAEIMGWVAEQRHTANRWDLIFVDPPTFSNSARMRKRGFDVQEDHAELLIGASRLLTRGGTIVFSCNLRGFTPDVEKLERAGVCLEDITPRTIPEDFSRNAKIHHCYLVRRSD